MSVQKKSSSKRRLSAGQVTGISLIGISIAIPGLFWGITYWRDITQTYCSGECATGWMAVISTMLAIPTIVLGTAILAISTAVKASKNQEKP